MTTYINDILLNYSTEIPRIRRFVITTETVQSTEYNDITRHVKRKLPNIRLLCALTGTDREEKFKEILALADSTELVTLTQEEIYENLMIKDIVETGKYEDVIEFNIIFQKVNLVEFETTGEPLGSKTQSLQPESSQGTQGTTTLNMEEPSYPA